ncbi:gluconokinase [Puniceibacterium sediminis]|uniref:Gluconokinase n=1 Tax=Puniceibacterium sediminis TaxID=1608407 RepID=A0A238XD51_9RHOB|nr:gluconokinase [Puniceibacterium sediminis]SNR56600.1 gluconate kinase, SKI family [Puniceibacterium sediminis]
MRHLLVMGVCGTGKSTVAKALSERLGAAFVEADAFHSTEAVARMASGLPLTDEHRWGWLDRIAEAAAAQPGGAVTACSALKQVYRTRLRATLRDMGIIFLHGSKTLLTERMAARSDHFMPISLLESQFADLEAPSGPGVLAIDVALPRDVVVGQACDFANAFSGTE